MNKSSFNIHLMNVTERMNQRPTKDEYFIEIAKLVATRSTCIRRNVGAVLVKDSHIISTGYNGPPAGLKHCTSETCVRTKMNIPSGEQPQLCRAVHAEINCIIQAARHGTSIDGYTTIYTTTFPCIDCTKSIINVGIKRIVYLGDYDESNIVREDIITESGIHIDVFDVDTRTAIPITCNKHCPFAQPAINILYCDLFKTYTSPDNKCLKIRATDDVYPPSPKEPDDFKGEPWG